jgi:hypothetical protein
MWKIINSPIVIAVIAIAAVFVLKATMKPKLASEIRGLYKELNAIIEDGASDAEKTRAIKEFAQEIATQIREGFSAGFKSDVSQMEDNIYIATKQKIAISGIKFVKSTWPSREKIMFVLKNNSDKYISSLKLNYEFYRENELVDCKNDWVSQIKILEPGQEIAISHERSLPKEETETYKSDKVNIKVTSFNIKKVEQ